MFQSSCMKPKLCSVLMPCHFLWPTSPSVCVAILFYYMHFSSTKWRQTSPHGPVVRGPSRHPRTPMRGASLWLRLFGAMFLRCLLVCFFAPRLSFTSGFTFSQLFRLWLFNSLQKVARGICADPFPAPIPSSGMPHVCCPFVTLISPLPAN